MKNLAPLLILCLAPALSAHTEKQYPLKVQLLESTWTNIGYGMAHGYGRGNIIDAESTHGFDFAYECYASFNSTTGNNYYPGRWKNKEEQRLIIQGSQIGGQHKSECELKTTLQRDVYLQKNGQLFLIAQDQFKNANENLRPPDKDPSHYAVKISILSADWQTATLGSMGSGKGNIVDGDNVEGFNFASTCAVTFQAGAGLYAAKWKEEKSKLVLLTKAIGENQFYTCDLKLDLIAGVYLKNNNTGVINRLTHDEFKAFLSQRRRTPVQAKTLADPVPPSNASASSVAKTRVNVLSDPDCADIEIDGRFVGSTPSALEWPIGEHSVSIRKLGYQEWKRTMTLVGGEVKINANLEKDPNGVRVIYK